MTPHVLNMPEQIRERAAWLEQHLLGLHLGELVAELKAIHGERAAAQTLDETLGSNLPKVLAQGLSELSSSEWHSLLTQPDLLLQLQERIFIDGGDYWNHPDKTPPEVNSRVQAQWQRLEQLLSTDVSSTAPSTMLAAQTQPVSHVAWWRHPLAVSMTTAAAVLVVVSLTSAPAPQPVAAWGWNKSNILVGDLSPSEYLRRLASSAEEWTKKRPETREELLKRLGQFRDGCTQIILAKHEPLPEADRAWLRERCQKWASKLDGHRQSLEGCAPEDILNVRGEIDATVANLAKLLNERAEAAAAA